MIQSLQIRNFKNFTTQSFEFSPHITLVYGDNGKGKSSLLDALSYLGNIQSKTKAEILVHKGESSFFLHAVGDEGDIKSSYDATEKKKAFLRNNKKTSQKKFFEASSKFCYFDPELMNLFVLGPSQRRDYINGVISNCFPGYQAILKHYNKILKSRNAVLKAISEGNAQEKEIDYWDESFSEAATEVYRYRFLFVDFFTTDNTSLQKCVGEKYADIKLQYISKIDFTNPKITIKKYLEENRQRDIIIQKTHIGPHRDDFTILVEGSPIQEFASRGEIKSIILGLKYIEAQFIEKHRQEKAIFLIDDFSSELDESHQKNILEVLSEYQIILTNIHKIKLQQEQTKYIHLI